jgi:hypothetical protein
METTMTLKNSIVFGAALAVVSFAALPAAAHHGWGGNSNEVSTMTGMVVEGVKLAGPHATMKIRAEDGKTWDLTLAPPFRTSSAGLKPDTIPVGSMVEVMGNKNLDPKRSEMKTVRVTYEGKRYTVYPEREAYLPPSR